MKQEQFKKLFLEAMEDPGFKIDFLKSVTDEMNLFVKTDVSTVEIQDEYTHNLVEEVSVDFSDPTLDEVKSHIRPRFADIALKYFKVLMLMDSTNLKESSKKENIKCAKHHLEHQFIEYSLKLILSNCSAYEAGFMSERYLSVILLMLLNEEGDMLTRFTKAHNLMQQGKWHSVDNLKLSGLSIPQISLLPSSDFNFKELKFENFDPYF